MRGIDCVVQPRLEATVVALLGLAGMWAVGRSGLAPVSPVGGFLKTCARHRTRLVLTVPAVVAYSIALFMISERFDSGGSHLTPPAVVRCAAEAWGARNFIAGVCMIVWMLYAVLPFLHGPSPLGPRFVHRMVIVLGVVVGLGAAWSSVNEFAGLGGANWAELVTKLTSIALGAGGLGLLFRSARRAAIAVFWPTLLIPITSYYLFAVTALFIMSLALVVAKIVQARPVAPKAPTI